MTREQNEMLGVMLTQSEKETIRKIAEKNNVTLSFVGRALIVDSLKNINERNTFKMEV